MQAKKYNLHSQSSPALIKNPSANIPIDGLGTYKKNIYPDQRDGDFEGKNTKTGKKMMNNFVKQGREKKDIKNAYCSQKISYHIEDQNGGNNYSMCFQGKKRKQQKNSRKNSQEKRETKKKKEKASKQAQQLKIKKKQGKIKDEVQKFKNKTKRRQLNNSNSTSMFKTFIENEEVNEPSQAGYGSKTHKNTRSQLLSNSQNQSNSSKLKHKMIIDLYIKEKNQSTHRGTYRPTSKFTLRTGERTTKIHEDLPSAREYCIIKGKFVPLESSSDRKYVDSIFQETAYTSHNTSQNKYHNKNQSDNEKSDYQTYRYEKNENECKEKGTKESSTLTSNANIGIGVNTNSYYSCHAEIGIQTLKTELKHYEVLVKAAQEDIGIQYSDRSSQNSARRLLQIKNRINEEPQSQYTPIKEMVEHEAQKSERTTLFETMMKLQALELNQNSALQNLNIEQKRHFRQICQSLLMKMKSPRIQNPPNISRNFQEFMQIQKLKTVLKEQPEHVQDYTAFKQLVKNEEFEQLLMLRESKQTNQFNIVLRSPEQVDTSLISVLSTFSDIFCFVQMNYEEIILQALNSFYGLSYGDRYKFVSKYYSNNKYQKENLLNTSISSIIKYQSEKRQVLLRALPDSIFLRFMKQMSEDDQDEQQENQYPKTIQNQQQKKCQSQSYLWTHNKCIFDCINELIVPYRPFYPTKGDPFPWTVSPLKCLTFYSIDSESLETVIQQVQQKITKMLKYLCGIHLQSNKYIAGNYKDKEESKDWYKDVVFSMRRDKLSKAIIDELRNEDFDAYQEIEIQTTCVLYEAAKQVQEEIFKELAQELSILYQRKI